MACLVNVSFILKIDMHVCYVFTACFLIDFIVFIIRGASLLKRDRNISISDIGFHIFSKIYIVKQFGSIR